MKATIYKSLSNAKEVATVSAGQTVANAFPEIDFENAVIIVNGRRHAKDYVLRESDVLAIRQLPAGAAALIGGAIFMGALAVEYGVYAGVNAYKAKQAAEKAQKELEEVKKLTNSSIDNRPFLRGATNTVATGNSQPYICGKHLFTPYLLCSPFYKLSGTDGKDEYTYTVLECGFSRQIIDSVSIDDIRIKKFNSATPQEASYKLDGGQVFADDGLIEISQDGELLTALPELNYKTVSKACNDEIPRDSRVADGKAEYLTYTLDANAKNVDVAITFPYGLYCYNDSGDKEETTVTITPQYSLDGGQTEEGWIPFTFDNNGTATNTFSNMDSKNELRYCAHHEFSLDDYQALKDNGQPCILIRVRSDGNEDDKIKNDCYVLFYQSVCFDAEKSSYPAGSVKDSGASGLVSCKIVEDRERAYCTIMGLRVKASAINEDKLKKISVITQGVARTWSRLRANWSAEKSATRNPAAWALEILTSDSHPASRFSDSEIDLESFGEFYEHCDDSDFFFDHVITQNTKKSATIQHIMESCGAVLYWDMYGRLAVAIDAPQENAIAVYNPQNIIGDPQNKRTFGRRTDGLRIKYITSDSDLFSEETYLVMREGQTLGPDSIIRDLTVTGITTHDHIVKYARRLMAVEALRPKTTTIEVGNEGVYFTPYSKILLQDDSLKIGLGNATIKEAQWYGGLLKKIILNEPVEFSETAACGIIVNCYCDNKAVPVALKVDGSGRTDTLDILTAYRSVNAAKPEAGNILSFGELDINGEFSKITTEYMISNITRSDSGFMLELINYNEAIYDSGAIPDYKSNIAKKPSSANNKIPGDFPTWGEVTDAIDSAAQRTEAVDELAELVTHGVRFSNVHKINPVTAETLERVTNLDELQRRLDEILQEGALGISLTKDALTIEMENTEAGLKTTIQQTAEQILAQAEDTKRELTAALAVQADAVQAMVEGGGASGQLSLSLELPAMITAEQKALFIQKSTEAKVGAVYARVDGTDYHSIKGNATDAQCKALWDDLCAAKLLASQIVLDADQINIAGATVFTSHKTSALSRAAQNNAVSAAAADALEKKNAAITAALSQIVGSSNVRDQTIISGGKIMTGLIDVDGLAAQIISLNNGGILKSANFDGACSGGAITGNGTAGFAIDSSGKAVLNNAVVRGVVNATSGSFKGTVNCKGFTLNVVAGVVFFKKIRHTILSAIGVTTGTKMLLPFNGTVRLALRMMDSSTAGNDDTTYDVYLGNDLVHSESHPVNGTTYESSFNIDVTCGKWLKITSNGGGRVSNCTFDCSVYTDSVNDAMSLLATVENY